MDDMESPVRFCENTAVKEPFDCAQAASCQNGSHFCLHDALSRFEAEAVHGTLDTGRYRCRYFVWGSGPPLVLVHGLGDLARGFVPVISLLSQRFRCLAYDLPSGHGDAAKLERYVHNDLVTDFFCLLDHVEMPRAYALGSSFGSTVTLAAMRQRPERIPRAVLAGGFARRPLAPTERLLAYLGCHLPGTMRHLPFRGIALDRAFGPSGPGLEESRKFFFETTSQPPIQALARRALMVHNWDFRANLSEIRQPVLMICSDGDTVVGRSCEEGLLEGLPNAARVEVCQCGHMSHYSHPRQIADLVTHFLTPPGSS
jgi:pimeloyl-ACP methyl ester carboxylesterase